MEAAMRKKILKGSEELFLRYGVRSVSMDDIARHLAISKKTVYQHFADKDELVLLVTHSYLEQIRVLTEHIRKEAKNPVDELARLFTCIRTTVESLNPSVMFDLEKYHPMAWKVWVDFKHTYLRRSIVRLLEEGMKEGYIRSEIDPEVMAAVRLEQVQLAFHTELFPDNRYTIWQLQEQIFDHFVHGLVTEKGRKLYVKYKSQVNHSNTVL
jgi:AcrR family transcriptional regulator